MPWVVGIDEAGYGPNLGPLVQAAVSLWLPDNDPTGWVALRSWVRRVHEPNDGRLLIDDSKKVYSAAKGFSDLERTVLALMAPHAFENAHRPTLEALLCPGYLLTANEYALVAADPWFDATATIPFEVDEETFRAALVHWTGALSVFGPSYGLQPRIVTAAAFNSLIAGGKSKAVALEEGLVNYLSKVPRVGHQGVSNRPGDPVQVLCDKLGGRNFYGPLLAAAFPDGWVVAERESADESRYRIENLGREVRVVFRPRADAGSVSVALASMLAKYTREVCMRQFNRFWAKHVPGLKPTAGYPLDAKRFFAEIKPAMAKLGIPDDAVWRVK
jgi:hypothetical protein